MNYRIGFFLAVTGIAVGPVHAHGGHAGGHADGATKAMGGEAKLFGRPGDPKRASRTVKVSIEDAACRAPGELSLRQGDTISFEITNSGEAEQEVVIGMLKDLVGHAKSAEKDDDIPHDESYMAHVHPGGTARIAWNFTRAGIFYYGCLGPGLPAPGVRNRIVVSP